MVYIRSQAGGQHWALQELAGSCALLIIVAASLGLASCNHPKATNIKKACCKVQRFAPIPCKSSSNRLTGVFFDTAFVISRESQNHHPSRYRDASVLLLHPVMSCEISAEQDPSCITHPFSCMCSNPTFPRAGPIKWDFYHG